VSDLILEAIERNADASLGSAVGFYKVRELVAEVKRLRVVDTAVKRACTHDAHCEKEGEGECCFRAWRAVVLAAGCARPVTHEDAELLAALHPEPQIDD
jgi:hypothetical protein